MNSISDRFNAYFEKISSPRFLNMEALGGEIPFYISAYNAKNELTIRKEIKGLKNKLTAAGKTVLEINLYDIACEIFHQKRKGISRLERLFADEQEKNKDMFLNSVQSALNTDARLIPCIKAHVDATNADVYFLTGVGAVYPYIRTHNMLNNLQNVVKDAPTVIFFPGKYDGNNLNLFGKMRNDNYYRAFDIDRLK